MRTGVKCLKGEVSGCSQPGGGYCLLLHTLGRSCCFHESEALGSFHGHVHASNMCSLRTSSVSYKSWLNIWYYIFNGFQGWLCWECHCLMWYYKWRENVYDHFRNCCKFYLKPKLKFMKRLFLKMKLKAATQTSSFKVKHFNKIQFQRYTNVRQENIHSLLSVVKPMFI